MAPLIPVEQSRPGVEPYLADVDRRAPHPGGRRLEDVRTNARVGRTGCHVIDLPRVADPRGNLTFVEGDNHIPFDIKRVYYLYDVPGGSSRGGHAHYALEALIIAAAGSFDVLVDDGEHQERFFLNRSYHGLYVPRMTWRELDNFSSGGVCLVLASAPYEEEDYIRDHDRFLDVARAERARADAA